MPHNETVALSGTIQNVFAHRFTLDAGGATHLADLGPKGAAAFPLSAGLAVTLGGERRPSEIKVTRIASEGREPVLIARRTPQHAPGYAPGHVQAEGPADPDLVLAAVRKAGWAAEGEPRRKPKHFEILARQKEGDWTELHVDFAGAIYTRKAADRAKWAAAAC